MKEKKRFFVLAGILLVMLLTFTSITLVSDYTRTRLIQRKQDEVKAYYTSLYFDSTGEGSAVAIDGGVGYVTFDLMNYIDEDVTERDIVYEILAPTKYYTNTNEEIASNKLSSDLSTVYSGADNTINVRDVWEQPKVVGRDTYKYSYSVFDSSADDTKETYQEVYPEHAGEILGSASATDYILQYEKLEGNQGTNAVGKSHTVTVEIKRNVSTPISGTEKISIVVQLLKPYLEVFIINMTISERLIVFSANQVTEFEIPIEELSIQTADIFAYEKSDSTDVRREFVSGTGDSKVTKVATSDALRVTLTWTNLILNEVSLKYIMENLNVVESNLGSLTGNNHFLTLLIPQGSSFTLQFFPTDKTAYSVTAKVEIMDASYINDDKTQVKKTGYAIYNDTYKGYLTGSEIGKNGAPTGEILVLNKSKENLVH